MNFYREQPFFCLMLKNVEEYYDIWMNTELHNLRNFVVKTTWKDVEWEIR
jgi:hypothetical protein